MTLSYHLLTPVPSILCVTCVHINWRISLDHITKYLPNWPQMTLSCFTMSHLFTKHCLLLLVFSSIHFLCVPSILAVASIRCAPISPCFFVAEFNHYRLFLYTGTFIKTSQPQSRTLLHCIGTTCHPINFLCWLHFYEGSSVSIVKESFLTTSWSLWTKPPTKGPCRVPSNSNS